MLGNVADIRARLLALNDIHVLGRKGQPSWLSLLSHYHVCVIGLGCTLLSYSGSFAHVHGL